jgi:ubiquinone/menaquinone biosynthesis C-methylase UbiE
MNRTFWNLKTGYYKLLRSIFPFKIILNKENNNLVALIKQVETENKIMLDLGVGTGNVLNFLKGEKHLFGLDLTFSMLKEAQKNFPKARLIQANVLFIPLKTKSIDMITVVGLVEYIQDTIPVIEELYRILKNESYLILTFSPKKFWTRMRLLLGHPVYPMYLDQVQKIVKRYQFQIIDNQQSLMQQQVLLQKRDN